MKSVRRNFGRLLLLFLANGALVACPGGGAGWTSCDDDKDCADARRCIGGTCVASGAKIDLGANGTDTGGVSSDGSPYRVPDGGECIKASFKLTETQDVFTVPSYVRYMHIKAWGAGGNGEGQCGSKNDGGLGGYTEAVFKVEKGQLVQPGAALIIIVGKRGRAGMTGEERIRFGFGDWGGGGLSGVFFGPKLITDQTKTKALLVAGGGGGASAPGCHPGGTGNHPKAGGQSTMQGGVGRDKVNGGGGGYTGGSGGQKGVGGNGGTGFVMKGAKDSRKLFAQPNTGLPPKTTDPDYADLAGQTEKSGRVVIHFVCSAPPIL